MTRLICLAAVLLIALPARAEPEAGPFLNDTTVVVAKVKRSLLSDETQRAWLDTLLPSRPAEIEPGLDAFRRELTAIGDAFGKATEVRIAVDLPYSSSHRFIRVRVPRDDVDRERFVKLFGDVRNLVIRDAGDDLELAFGAPREGETVDVPHTQQRSDLQEFLNEETADVAAVRIALPEHARQIYATLLPTSFPALNLKSATAPPASDLSALVGGVASLTVRISDRGTNASIVLDCLSPAHAEDVSRQMQALLRLGSQEAGLRNFPMAGALLMLQPQVEGRQVTLKLDAEALKAFAAPLMPAVVELAGVRAKHQQVQNLKQIMLAIHNYYDTHKQFPTDTSVGNPEQRGLSWRVHVLPFLGEQELYSKFQLDEPWDSETNKRLIAKMPVIFRAPGLRIAEGADTPPPGRTPLLAVVGKNTVMGQTPPTKFEHVTDGTSNTIVLVEVAVEHSVPWTKPADYRFDPQRPTQGLAVRGGRFLSAFADGSTRAIRSDMPAASVRNLYNMRDGNPVELD